MMGDRDFRSVIKTAIESIGRELDVKVDVNDPNTIHLHEVTRCLRRSYYDRTEPLDVRRSGFNELLSGLLQKYGYGTEHVDYPLDPDMDRQGQDGVKIRARADMMVDDAVILFRSSDKPPRNPKASDILFLNACLWIYDKFDGIIVYISGDMQESSFSATRDKKMFEETVRRVRVLTDLLREKKAPIIEPSSLCESCQYYEKCYIKERVGKSFNIKELVGINKD